MIPVRNVHARTFLVPRTRLVSEVAERPNKSYVTQRNQLILKAEIRSTAPFASNQFSALSSSEYHNITISFFCSRTLTYDYFQHFHCLPTNTNCRTPYLVCCPGLRALTLLKPLRYINRTGPPLSPSNKKQNPPNFLSSFPAPASQLQSYGQIKNFF